MALNKTGYKGAILGNTTATVGLNSSGNIAQTGETVISTKKLSFDIINAENALAENLTFTNIFIGFIGGTQNVDLNTMKVTWEV